MWSTQYSVCESRVYSTDLSGVLSNSVRESRVAPFSVECLKHVPEEDFGSGLGLGSNDGDTLLKKFIRVRWYSSSIDRETRWSLFVCFYFQYDEIV